MTKITKNKIFTSVLWMGLGNGGDQVVRLITGIILARLIMPSEFGVIAIVEIFITLSNSFIHSGFKTSLLQKKDIDDIDINSVFFINLFSCILIYASMLLGAQAIANYYGMPQLVPLFKVLPLTLFISIFKVSSTVILTKQMKFRTIFTGTIIGTLSSAVVGITMAYAGFKVWALVGQQLTNILVSTLVLYFHVKWRPSTKFSFERIKSLFSFGWKLLVSSMIENLYNNLSGLIIGKKYSADTLSFYKRGSSYPQLLSNTMMGTIDSVMFPVLAQQQDDKARIKQTLKKYIQVSSFIVFPVMVGMGVVADKLIILLLTEKWAPSIPFIRLFCVSSAFQILNSANLQAIKAIGRSDVFLKLEIIKKLVGLALLVIGVYIGVYAIALSFVVTTILSNLINSFPNKKFLGYGFKEQIVDISHSISLSLVMGIVVYAVSFIGLSDLVTFILQIITGIVVYVLAAKVTKMKELELLLEMVKHIITKTKEKTTK